MSTQNEELWSIALPSGEIRKGTIDQLDDAFNAGLVTEESLVLAPGATEWTRLGDLAGLDANAPSPMPAPLIGAPSTLRPVMTNLAELVEPTRPRSRTPVVAGVLGAIGAIAAVIAIAVTGIGESPDASKAAAAGAATGAPKPTVTAQKPVTPIADDVVPQKPALTDAQKKALQEADEARAKLLKASKKDDIGPRQKSKGISDSAGFGSPGKGSGKCTCRAGDPLCSCM